MPAFAGMTTKVWRFSSLSVRSSGSRRLGQVVADLVEAPLQRQPIKRSDRQADEDRDAVVEPAVDVGEEGALFGLAADEGGRIGDAPKGGHGLARPVRTGLAGGLVANGEDEIQRRRVRA